MIVGEFTEIIGNNRNIKYYKDKGYDIKIGDKILIRTVDLSNGSTFKVNVRCDKCFIEKKVDWSSYYKYTKGLTEEYNCISCCSEKRKETNNIRYGGNSPNCDPKIAKKMIETNIERYGNGSSLHGSRQEIIEEIFVKKYGNKSPSTCDFIKDKTKKTNIERYGGTSPLSSSEILNKVKKTNMERYGFDNVSKSPDIISKIKNIFDEKYGTWYTKTDEMKNKSRETCLSKYGSNNYKESEFFINDVIQNRLKNYNLDIVSYKKGFFMIKCQNCGKEYEIRTDLLYKRNKENRDICTICNKIGMKFSSSYEDKICDILKEYDIKFERNNNKIISPHHIDIYVPSLNLAIEFNGMYWHSDIFKDKKYHLNKYLKCGYLNINLIQIWEDDWINKMDIVKSIILNKIGKNINKIFARKCDIRLVSSQDSKEFLDKNHLQGNVRSSINIGLFYENTLVSLMTFGKRKINNTEQYELLRFCNILNTSVVGGASKIFKYFDKNYNFDLIVSYSDNSISDGDIYLKLGFVNNTKSTINYYWCDNKKRYHRFNFNKKRLVKMGFDRNKTEVEIMRERGYNRIFGAGNKRWEFRKTR
jgi:hypothetical protein